MGRLEGRARPTLVEILETHAGPGEVRIKVATVNPTDTGLRSGVYGSGLQSRSPTFPAWTRSGSSTRSAPGATR